MKKLITIIGIIGIVSSSSLFAANGDGFKKVWGAIFEPFVDVTKAAFQLTIPTPESRICTFVNVDWENVEEEKILNAPYNPNKYYSSSFSNYR